MSVLNNGLSVKASDCTSKIHIQISEPKSSVTRIKCEATDVNVIAPIYNEELHIYLNKSDFVCIITDASSRFN
jgi:hypothetical protein